MIIYPPGSVFGTVNSFVHTVMYSYYFLASFGHRPWWGKYVTRLQITQMVIGICASTGWAYFYYLTDQECSLWSPHLKHYGIEGLSIENTIFIASLLLYASYFILFLNLYLNRFVVSEDSPAPVKGKGKGGKGKGGKEE